ncbi:hypothetical protein ABTI08_20890, partial [Acinetobacter baumannii]
NNAKPDRYDISDTVKAIVQMHQTNTALTIQWQKEDGTYIVYADKTQMNRLFTNLIKNAIEASEKHNEAGIIIHQSNNS